MAHGQEINITLLINGALDLVDDVVIKPLYEEFMSPNYPGIRDLCPSKTYPLSFGMDGLFAQVEEPSDHTEVTINLYGDLSDDTITFLEDWARKVSPYMAHPTFGVLYDTDAPASDPRIDVITMGRTLKDRLTALKASVLELGVLYAEVPMESAIRDILKDRENGGTEANDLTRKVGKMIGEEYVAMKRVLGQRVGELFDGLIDALADDNEPSPR